MSISVNRIPSIGIPLTDKSGRISPVWYEFLRAFVAATVEDESGNGNAEVSVIAGAGLTGGGEISSDVTLNVGAGSGITVNANDVNLDISNQTFVTVTNEDELIISDVSDNNSIRKTRVRDINALASNPGGNDTEIQYNDNGVFAGDSGFTTNGSGSITITSDIDIGGTIKFSDETVGVIRFDGVTGGSVPRIQSDGTGGYTLYAKQTGLNLGSMTFSTATNCITMNFGTGNNINFANTTSGGPGFEVQGDLPFRRAINAAITASTTQTQGNGALTRDYNNVSTVANVNDTVTLPAALAGRYCTVRNAGANILQVFPASGDDLGFGANTATTIRPGAHFTWFAIDATTWHQTDGLLRHTVVSSITASTTQTQGQQPLTADINEVSTVANVNDTVTLPTAPSYSRTIIIINNGANTLQIFPSSGDNLGAGVDTSTTLASGSNVRYTNYNATNWEAI